MDYDINRSRADLDHKQATRGGSMDNRQPPGSRYSRQPASGGEGANEDAPVVMVRTNGTAVAGQAT